jgi:hypothetical protein
VAQAGAVGGSARGPLPHVKRSGSGTLRLPFMGVGITLISARVPSPVAPLARLTSRFVSLAAFM